MPPVYIICFSRFETVLKTIDNPDCFLQLLHDSGARACSITTFERRNEQQVQTSKAPSVEN